MAEVVEGQLGDAGGAGGGLEDAVHEVVRLVGRAGAGGEEEALRVGRARELLLAQELDCGRAEVDRASAGARLRPSALPSLASGRRR